MSLGWQSSCACLIHFQTSRQKDRQMHTSINAPSPATPHVCLRLRRAPQKPLRAGLPGFTSPHPRTLPAMLGKWCRICLLGLWLMSSHTWGSPRSMSSVWMLHRAGGGDANLYTGVPHQEDQAAPPGTHHAKASTCTLGCPKRSWLGVHAFAEDEARQLAIFTPALLRLSPMLTHAQACVLTRMKACTTWPGRPGC